MTIRHHESPDQFRGKGVVFVAWDDPWGDGGTDAGYWGYWDLAPDGPPTPLEECPRSSSAPDVVRWGRDRTDSVLIRPKSDPDRHYWAGAGPAPAQDREIPVWVEE